MLDVFIFVIVFFGAIAYYRSGKKKFNLPPGPWSFPIIGSAVQVALVDHKRPFVAFQELAKKYGNVMSLNLGAVNGVVVSGFTAIKDMQTNPEFINRLDDTWLLDKTNDLPYGLLFSKGDHWVETRRLTHRLLKEYGFGKQNTMENLALEEIKVFSDEMRAQITEGNNVFEFDLQFHNIFLNTTLVLMTGTRFEHGHPIMVQLTRISRDYAESGQIGGGIAGLFPGIIHLAPDFSGFTKHHKVNMELLGFMEDLVESWRKQGTYKKGPGNFIESFLELLESEGFDANTKGFETPLTLPNLVGILQDLVLAGNDTQSHLMNFAVRYLVQYPNVQAKMQEEIDHVIGSNRWVTLDDKPMLKYTQAVMFELLRIANVIPIVPRKTHKDSKLYDFDIPKGTLIFPNYWSANMDEKVWEEPHVLKPERFLTTDGELTNTEKIMSFGIGRRNCIGESTAKSSVLMVLTSLVQQFNFGVDPKSGMPGDETMDHFTRNPIPFKVQITLRH